MREPSAPTQIRFDGRNFVRWNGVFWISAAILVAFADYHINYAAWINIGAVRRLFNAAREDGIGSFLSITQTCFIALSLWGMVVLVRSRKDVRWVRVGWVILAVFFSYLAIDDGSKVHERLATAYDVFMDHNGGTRLNANFPSYTWQVVFLPIFVGLGVFMMVFLSFRLRTLGQKLLVVGGLGCLVAAISLDFIEGLAVDHPLNLYSFLTERFRMAEFTIARFGETPYDTLRHFSKVIEESTEMIGMNLIWSAFLLHMVEIGSDVRIRTTRASIYGPPPTSEGPRPIREDRRPAAPKSGEAGDSAPSQEPKAGADLGPAAFEAPPSAAGAD